MLGLMQSWPLTCDKILDFANEAYPDREVITRSLAGPIERVSYAEIYARARRASSTMAEQYGIKLGDRVATMAWNTARHLETWYAAIGLGAVYHTVNPRLFPEQIVYIVNHAEDRLMFVDPSFVGLLEKLQDQLPTIERYVVLCDYEDMPETSLRNAICYEQLVAEGTGNVVWGGFDEDSACGLCYTSGTTGNPKGVLYSHRGNVIHALAACMGDAVGLRARDVVMPVVPMYHANAWGVTFSAPMAGASLVMPGDKMDGASIYELLDAERVTITLAVPTVWLALLQHLEANGLELPHLNRVVIGGAAAPEFMIRAFEDRYGVEVVHVWGMTEMSPIGTMSVLPPAADVLTPQERGKLKLKQGRTIFSVEMRVKGADGQDVKRDGKSFGDLQVRGPAVASAYFKGEGGDPLDDGWLKTGDVATVDEFGFMQIVDRTKDVIKSGGEWISTIEIENAATGCPGVAEAAVIGRPHPKWDERPLLVVKRAEGAQVSEDEVLAFLQGKVAKWQIPDAVAFVDELPHTATGKLDKKVLRETFADYVLPTAGASTT